MSLLGSQISARNIREALITLPQGVFVFYDQALKRISEQEDSNRDLANRALSLIFCAKRNLTMNELIHALSIEPGDNDFSAENCTLVQILLGVCAGLVRKQIGRKRCVLLENGADIDAIDTIGGCTALTIATWLGNDAMVQLLVEKGADVNMRQRSGETALHIAARDGYPDLVELLVRNGARVDLKLHGWTAMLLAVSNQRGWIPDFLVHQGANFGWEAFARLLSVRGAQVDAVNRWGRTPLMWAVYGKQYAIVEILLGHGADITLGMHEGYTPLHLAADNGDERMIDILLSRGAPVGARAQNEWTAYHIANVMTFNGVMTRLAIAGAVKSEASELRAARNADEHQGDEWYIDFGRDDIARTWAQRSQQASSDDGTLDVAV
ncbi:hypothetical protein SCUP234_06775 [Seiridium cupressi]